MSTPKKLHPRVLLLAVTGAILSGCVSPTPIAEHKKVFKRPVVIAALGTTVHVERIGTTAGESAYYEAGVPEWKMSEYIEEAAVQRLKARGIKARAGGAELRGQFLTASSFRKGNRLGLTGINERRLQDAAQVLTVGGADSVLFITAGFEPLPTGRPALMSGYGMCEVSVMGMSVSYCFAPVRAFALTAPGGERLGFGPGTDAGPRSVPVKSMPFTIPWEAVPDAQKAALKKHVQELSLASLDKALQKLGLGAPAH